MGAFSERVLRSWTTISGATADTYTPDAADVGRYLLAAVSYTDEEGASKRALADSVNSVLPVPVGPNEPPEFPSNTTSRNVDEHTPADTRTSASPSRPPTPRTTP